MAFAVLSSSWEEAIQHVVGCERDSRYWKDVADTVNKCRELLLASSRFQTEAFEIRDRAEAASQLFIGPQQLLRTLEADKHNRDIRLVHEALDPVRGFVGSVALVVNKMLCLVQNEDLRLQVSQESDHSTSAGKLKCRLFPGCVLES